jgi:hypothetical protein
MYAFEKEKESWKKPILPTVFLYFITIFIFSIIQFLFNLPKSPDYLFWIYGITGFFMIMLITGIFFGMYETRIIRIDHLGIFVRAFRFDKEIFNEYITPDEYTIKLGTEFSKSIRYILIIKNKNTNTRKLVISDLHSIPDTSNKIILEIFQVIKTMHPEFLKE